jgi:tRNA(Glu) U13 pseudouridine synthase TruD
MLCIQYRTEMNSHWFYNCIQVQRFGLILSVTVELILSKRLFNYYLQYIYTF